MSYMPLSVWKNPHRLIMSSAFNFEWIIFILANKKNNYKARMSLNFSKIPSLTSKLSALERLKNQ